MTRRMMVLVPLGGLLAVALLIGSGSLRAEDEVPFKGDAVSQYVGEDVNGIFVTAYWEIVSGNITHLGKVTGEAEVYWMQIQPEPDPIYIPLGASIVLVAANGDELHLEHTPDYWDPSTSTAYSTYEITGGTGRFADATGSGTTTASGYGTVTNTWNGTIEYKEN